MKKAILFDMDGTILDTLKDLTNAINETMRHFGHRANYSTKECGMFFGSGVVVALKRALAYEAGYSYKDLELIGTKKEETLHLPAFELEDLQEYYRPFYASHCKESTKPYPGILQMIRDLKEAGLLVACISNKPNPAVQALCQEHFEGAFDFALGEIPQIPRKPEACMIQKALEALACQPEEALYVGDSEIDLLTAKNSGMEVILVDWGFRSRNFLLDQGANKIVSNCQELKNSILQA